VVNCVGFKLLHLADKCRCQEVHLIFSLNGCQGPVIGLLVQEYSCFENLGNIESGLGNSSVSVSGVG
jgi:hypothetical protein